LLEVREEDDQIQIVFQRIRRGELKNDGRYVPGPEGEADFGVVMISDCSSTFGEERKMAGLATEEIQIRR